MRKITDYNIMEESLQEGEEVRFIVRNNKVTGYKDFKVRLFKQGNDFTKQKNEFIQFVREKIHFDAILNKINQKQLTLWMDLPVTELAIHLSTGMNSYLEEKVVSTSYSRVVKQMLRKYMQKVDLGEVIEDVFFGTTSMYTKYIARTLAEQISHIYKNDNRNARILAGANVGNLNSINTSITDHLFELAIFMKGDGEDFGFVPRTMNFLHKELNLGRDTVTNNVTKLEIMGVLKRVQKSYHDFLLAQRRWHWFTKTNQIEIKKEHGELYEIEHIGVDEEVLNPWIDLKCAFEIVIEKGNWQNLNDDIVYYILSYISDQFRDYLIHHVDEADLPWEIVESKKKRDRFTKGIGVKPKNFIYHKGKDSKVEHSFDLYIDPVKMINMKKNPVFSKDPYKSAQERSLSNFDIYDQIYYVGIWLKDTVIGFYKSKFVDTDPDKKKKLPKEFNFMNFLDEIIEDSDETLAEFQMYVYRNTYTVHFQRRNHQRICSLLFNRLKAGLKSQVYFKMTKRSFIKDDRISDDGKENIIEQYMNNPDREPLRFEFVNKIAYHMLDPNVSLLQHIQDWLNSIIIDEEGGFNDPMDTVRALWILRHYFNRGNSGVHYMTKLTVEFLMKYISKRSDAKRLKLYDEEWKKMKKR